MRFLVVNGPNLDRLGTREPKTYGSTTLAELEGKITNWASSMGADADFFQSASEAKIIAAIHGFDGEGIVINPGAFTHTSRAIADAIRAIPTPVVEVHISNVKRREPWRAESVLAESCARTIYGRGVTGYRDALRHLLNRLALPFETIQYGPHQDNVGDLRRGGGDLVVFAHGGIWLDQYERDTTESLCVDLTNRGFDTWNIEYRRLGTGGGWPASAHDVLMALDFVPQMRLGSRRTIVISHSAGSHLSAWAAPRARTTVDLHVALGPLLDLGASVEGDHVCGPGAKTMIEGGSPAVMTPDGIKTVIVHGDADEIVPVDHSVRYAEVHHVEHHRSAASHFSLLDPSRPEWEWVVGEIGAAT